MYRHMTVNDILSRKEIHYDKAKGYTIAKILGTNEVNTIQNEYKKLVIDFLNNTIPCHPDDSIEDMLFRSAIRYIPIRFAYFSYPSSNERIIRPTNGSDESVRTFTVFLLGDSILDIRTSDYLQSASTYYQRLLSINVPGRVTVIPKESAHTDNMRWWFDETHFTYNIPSLLLDYTKERAAVYAGGGT